MKNSNYIFATLTLILLFSIVSCQKEDINETFINESSISSDRISYSSNLECIDFESPSWSTGETPYTVFTTEGGNAIEVYGVNPSYKGINAAMIFNSSYPLGGDFDLGSPNRVFGGPGIGKAGSTEPYANRVALGKILIVSDDLSRANPNDLESVSRLKFDFLDWGAFRLHSMTVIDIEGSSAGDPIVELLDAEGTVVARKNLPITGNNGVATVSFDNSSDNSRGAIKMVVHLFGSGGIDNICVERIEN